MQNSGRAKSLLIGAKVALYNEKRAVLQRHCISNGKVVGGNRNGLCRHFSEAL